MEVYHIYHSGFLFRFEEYDLLFDYYRGDLPDDLGKDKPLYVVASHVHPDHFHFCIFEIFRNAPKVHYLLSHDIHKKYNEKFFLKKGCTKEQYERISFLASGEEYRYEDGKLRIRTLVSTDRGNAYLVDAMEHRIYHAGDLNWWLCEEAEHEKKATIEKLFKEQIQKLGEYVQKEKKPIEAACLSLDPRQGACYAKGFDYIMRNVEVAAAYPMHFWDEREVISRLMEDPVSEPYRERIKSVPYFSVNTATQ